MRRADGFRAESSRGAGVKTTRVKREVSWKNTRGATGADIFWFRRFTLASALRCAAMWMLQCKKSIEIGKLQPFEPVLQQTA